MDVPGRARNGERQFEDDTNRRDRAAITKPPSSAGRRLLNSISKFSADRSLPRRDILWQRFLSFS